MRPTKRYPEKRPGEHAANVLPRPDPHPMEVPIMAKARRQNTTTSEDETRQLAAHWQKRADEFRRLGRTAEAATAERLAEQYERQSPRGGRR